MKLPAMIIFCASASIGLPQLVAAQDISWKLSQMKPGDYVAHTTNSKEVEHKSGVGYTIYSGRQGRFYVTKSYQGSGQSAELLITNYRDKNGNSVRAVYPDGFEYRYRPHNCGRTLGQCKFTVTLSDGRKVSTTNVTEFDKGRVTWTAFDKDGQWETKGWFEIDERGSALKSSIVGRDGRRRDAVAAQAFYK